jgi:hypothetical protein
MTTLKLGLILTALSCAEPTAIYQRPAEREISAQPQEGSSYSISSVDRTIYVRLTTGPNGRAEPVHAFLRQMFQSADSADAQRLVIDLRAVTGNDARLLVSLIKGIVTRERFAQPAGLYVIVGPRSFSPEQNAATLLREYANPIFLSAH